MSDPTHPNGKGRFLARFFTSVRFRLTLWYLGLLTLILCVFGLTVYYSQQSSLSAQFNDILRARIQQLALTYDDSTGQLAIAAPVSSNKPLNASAIRTGTRGLNVNEVGVLLSPQGDIVQTLGDPSHASVTTMIRATLKASADMSSDYLVSLPNENLTLASSGKPLDYGLVGMAIVQQQRVVAYLTFGAPSGVSRQLSALATTLLVAGALVLLLAALGGFWLAGRAMRPIQAITATAQQIDASDLSQRLALRRRDELGELAGTFDHMLDRLENAFTRQRQFTADASHELRTPLTIIELEVSRLLEKPTMTDHQRAALTVIQQERQHMAHLVDDLLLLARADAGHAQVRHEIVHLDELVLEVVERYASLAEQRRLHVQVDTLPELATRGDHLYLARMLGNLVENALKYSGPDGSRVRLALSPCARGTDVQWARLTISDDGQGIAAEHLPHIFERFYRAELSRTHSIAADGAGGTGGADDPGGRAGSGLGLAIARWIAQAHGGDLTIHSEVGAGTVCVVSLPLAGASGVSGVSGGSEGQLYSDA